MKAEVLQNIMTSFKKIFMLEVEGVISLQQCQNIRFRLLEVEHGCLFYAIGSCLEHNDPSFAYYELCLRRANEQNYD